MPSTSTRATVHNLLHRDGARVCGWMRRTITHALWMLALPGAVPAATLGLPETTARIGYAAGPAYVSLDHADSDPNYTWALAHSLIYTDWFLAGTRYWAALRYGQAEFDGGVSRTGEHMTFYGARLSVQYNFRLGAKFAPWLGAGIDLSQSEYTERHTVDEDGYLAKTYPSRTTTSMGVVFNANHEWAIGRAFHVGAQVEQLIAGDDRLRETTLSAAVLYRY